MPTEIYLSQKQQGKTLTLNITICSQKNDIAETTEPISVNDLAFIRLTFQHILKEGMFSLESSVAYKILDEANCLKVRMKLTTNNETKAKEWICSDDWAEIKLSSKQRNFCVEKNVVVTNLELNITAQEIKPAHLHLRSYLRKLYDDTELIDFHLRATDGTVGIHKAFLGIFSDVFMMMLKREWKETQEGEIALQGVTKQILQDLKQYIYLGTLPEYGLEPLLVIATRYMMDELKADCIAKMVQAATPEEINDLIEFACLNNLPDLMRAVMVETSDPIVARQLESKVSKEKVKDETE